jgi:predicted amidohydrolase
MLIISAVQFRPMLAKGPADVRSNFIEIQPLIHEAWKTGSQLIVFPELCLTGYSFLDGEEAANVAERWDGPTFRNMRDAAVELEAYLAYGYLESDGSRLYNSATMIDPTGKVVCRYRKVNLWGNDFLWATPGSEIPPIVQTDFGTISTVICRDIRAKIPSNIPRVASSVPFFAEEKPQFIAACTNWGKGGFPSTTWMDFATNNQCTLILANRYGVESNGAFSNDFGHGGSLIIEPNWKVHTKGLKFGENCVVSAALEI